MSANDMKCVMVIDENLPLPGELLHPFQRVVPRLKIGFEYAGALCDKVGFRLPVIIL